MESWFNASPNPFPDGNKFKLTRWNLLSRHPSQGPRTIEFQQAAGSVDPSEIGKTIRFYVALLRCAEQAAAASSEEAACCVDSKIDAAVVTLDGLLELLDLLESVREYWRSRAERLAEECFFALRDPSALKHWQKCNVCAASHERRMQCRVRRGEQEKGWQAFLKGNSKGRALWNKFSKYGVFKKDTWTRQPTSLEPLETEAVARPVKFSKKNSKGKKQTFTRKEKASAKGRARVKARKEAEKRCETPSRPASDQLCHAASVDAPSEPAGGW